MYPWGNVWDANNVARGTGTGGQLPTVGSYPQGVSWVGVLDMSGSVLEWTSSLYVPYPYDESHENSANVVSSRILRGGSFNSVEYLLSSSYRQRLNPSVEYHTVGLRCVRDVESTNNSQTVSVSIELESALEIAVNFTGDNADWTPFNYTFSDDPSNAEMVLVPVGSFMMGDENGEIDEQPRHTQTFDEPFWIDRTEVTREQWQICVEAGICDEEIANQWSSTPNQPINFINWFQARDYCEWREMRLPTEVEWEYVARGPESWLYPWGNVWNEDHAVHNLNSNLQTLTVGSLENGMSWVGALDMVGNVWEWVSSIYDDYPYDTEDGRETLDDQRTYIFHVLRGGSYDSTLRVLYASNRYSYYPNIGNNSFGFRCVRDVD